jgi:hypothetical protein
MSDVPPTTEEQCPCTAPHPAKETSPLRLIVLLLVFGVALACLLYDYTIARPAIKKALISIQGLLEGSIKDPSGDGAVTEDEVQSLLGSKPSRVTQLETGKIEVYSWRSGLPYRTYDLYVVYSGQKLPLLHSATTNEEPTGDQLPENAVILNKVTEGDLKSSAPGKKSISPPPPMSVSAPGVGPEGNMTKMNGEAKAPAGEKAAPDNGAAGGDQGTQPPTEEPKTAEPAPTTEPAKEEPAKEEPAKEEPAKEEPAKEEPAKEEPAKEEPAKEEPAKEEPAKEQPPAGDQPAKEEPAKTPDGGGQA